MSFNKFTFTVLFIVLLIAATSFLMIWSFEKDYLVVAKFTFSAIWLFEIIYLLHYVTKTNRSLNVFLESLRGADFVKSEKDAGTFDALNLTYNDIVDVIKDARLERESQYHYFQYTLELIPVGVLSYNISDGKIELFNSAAKALFNRERITHIKELDHLTAGLSETVKNLTPEHNRLITISHPLQEQKVLIRAKDFSLFKEHIKVVSFQNIKRELEEEELHAWQRLISVLRHEVMNSAGPVNSLSRTLLRMLRKDGRNKSASEITDKTINDAITGLESIESRAKGMIDFVQSYRELTKIPAPNKEQFSMDALTSEVATLMRDTLNQQGIQLTLDNQASGIPVDVDKRQISQVMINLLKNASEAFPAEQTEKRIVLSAYTDENTSKCIAVEDNGCGIPDEIREKMFVPFYTTKENGSGIGLNFARQIMSLHDARIYYRPGNQSGSIFVLEF
jgi:nitrogen fixation/metabolism regulation signal transduction histidine kinase